MHTQKFGASIRKQADKAINSKRARYECPRCHKLQVRNVSFSMWRCKVCTTTFAGGAYTPKTAAGEINARLIAEYAQLS